jgi:hypothetical protein
MLGTMDHRFRLAVVAVVALAASLALAACVGGGPTRAPDRRLVLQVGPSPRPLPSGDVFGCRQALIGGVLIGARDGRLVELGPDGVGSAGITWPFGFTAWLVDGVAEVRAPDGLVVAREGEVLSFGGGLGNDGTFGVCEQSWFAHMSTPVPAGT